MKSIVADGLRKHQPDLWDGSPNSTREMAEHGSEPHARLLVTGDGKCHNRKIQHEEGGDQLDVVFHHDNLVDRRHDRGQSVRSATRRQGQQRIVGRRLDGYRNHDRHDKVVKVL